MKIQDLVFVLVIILSFFLKKPRLAIIFGLLCLFLAVPFFYFQIFFTAERLTWYAAAFILMALFFRVFGRRRIRSLKIVPKLISFFPFLALGMIIFNLSRPILLRKEQYFNFDYWQRFERLEYVYQNSQYVSKTPSQGFIPDEAVNAYAGGAYVKGISPILIAPDTPPLGRYMIGWSALLFNNENIFILVAGTVSLVLMYLLGRQIFQNQKTALLPPLLFSFEPIFKNQLFYTPLLDILQLPFLLLCFLFFNLAFGFKAKGKFFMLVLANLSLGAFISIKYYITGLTVVGAWSLVLLYRWKEKKVKNNWLLFILALPFSVLVLLLSYLKVFLENHNLRQLLGIQKWVFLYHKSQLVNPFSIWPLILLNRWHVWFGDQPVLKDSQWRLSWPVVFIVSLAAAFLYFSPPFLKHHFPAWRKGCFFSDNKNVEILLLWVVVYVASMSFGQTTARYLVIYLPVLYLVAVYFLENISIKYKKR